MEKEKKILSSELWMAATVVILGTAFIVMILASCERTKEYLGINVQIFEDCGDGMNSSDEIHNAPHIEKLHDPNEEDKDMSALKGLQ